MIPTPEQRAEWRRLADAATEGPLYFQHWGGQNQNGDYAESILFDGRGETMTYGLANADGEFIAAAREAVPALLDALDAAEAERDAALARIEKVREVHRPVLEPGTPIYCCDECGVPVESEPCATIAALDGEVEA